MSIYRMRTEFGHYLKPILFLIALIFLIGAIYSFGVAPSKSRQGPEGGSDIIAKVNGGEITRTDFENAWSSYQERAREAGVHSPLQYADMRASILQQMVSSYLMLSAAQQVGVDVSDRKVDEQVEKAVTEMLKQNRESVLGKKKYKNDDPRRDDEYKSELANAGTSLSQQEEFFREKMPRDQIRAQIAQEGLVQKIKSGIKPVTERDVTDSYNVYKLTQIMLMSGKGPQEQLETKANKVASEAKAGGDFAALAKMVNAGGPLSKTGGKGEYSWQTRFMYPPEVREAIEKLKPGEVTSAIKTSFGFFIVKLDSVTPKLPANMDKKTTDARRKEIMQDREMSANMAFGKQIQDKQRVEVFDPELKAYWQLYQAQRAFSNPMEYRKLRDMAIASLGKAIRERPNNTLAMVKLAQLYSEEGQTDKAVRLLYPMLEGKTAVVDTPDLRVLLGDLFVKQNKKDKAIDNYKIASESARNDPAIHEQLTAKFKQLGRPDLVVAEQRWKADYDKRAAAMKALEAKTAPKPAPGAPRK